MMSGAGFYNYARLFDQTWATSTQGNDTAKLYDSVGNDILQAAGDEMDLVGNTFDNCVNNFAKVMAYSTNGGTDTADVQATDSVFQQIGDWS